MTAILCGVRRDPERGLHDRACSSTGILAGTMAISTHSPESLSATAADAVAGSESEDAEVTDGRLLRRKRNEETVVDALLDLYRRGNLQPSAEEIAAHAGLSPRSLFRYFDDVDDLVRTAIARIERQELHLVPIDIDPRTDLAVKAKGLADHRFRLYDAVGHTAAVLRLRSPFHRELQTALARNRAFMRGQMQALFAPELHALGSARAPAALVAADVLCSFESYQLFHDVHRLPSAVAADVVADGLTALFSPRR
jgi:AcrR family transcriptional regulator